MVQSAQAPRRVQPGEWRIVLLAGFLMFSAQVGLYVGAPGVEGMFLSRFGAGALPYMYMMVGVAVPLVTLGFTAILGRVTRTTVYRAVAPAMAVVLLGFRFLVAIDRPWIFAMLYVSMNLLMTLQSFYTWGVAGAVCTTRQAKRLFPFVAAGGIAGSSIGGLTTGPIVAVIGTPNLLLVWGGLLLVSAALTWALSTGVRESGTKRKAEPVLESLRRGYQIVRRSPLLPAYAVMTLLFVTVFFLLLMPFSRLVVERFPSDSEIASFFGLFQGVATGTALLVSVLVSNRLYARLGFIGTLLGYALIFVVGFAVSSVAPRFEVVVLFRYVQIAAFLGLALPAYQGVFNVVPEHKREQARLFVDGVLSQFGMLLAGGLLVVLELAPGLRFHFGAALLPAVVLVAAVVSARRRYHLALADALREGSLGAFDDEVGVTGQRRRNRAAVEGAVRILADGDPNSRRAAAEALAIVADRETVRDIAPYLYDDDPAVRLSVIRTIGGVGATEASLELMGALRDPDSSVRLEAVRRLAGMVPYAVGLSRAVEPLIDDEDLGVAAAAASVLLRGPTRDSALERLRRYIECDDERPAVIAMKAFADAPGAADGGLIERLLFDAREEVCVAAMRAGAAVDPESYAPAIVEALSAESPLIRSAAEEICLSCGEAAREPLLSRLGEYEVEPVIIRLLSRLPGTTSRRQLETYRQSKLAAVRECHDLLHALGSDHKAVADALFEKARDEALLSLATSALLIDPGGVAVAMENVRSADSQARSNAVEYFDAVAKGTEEKTAVHILETGSAGSHQAAGDPSTPDELIHRLSTHVDPWVRAVSLHTFGDAVPCEVSREYCSDENEVVRDAAARLAGGEMDRLPTIPMVDRVVFLRQTPLLSQIETRDLQRFASACDEEHFDSGEILAREGDVGDKVFIIAGGEVSIVKRDGAEDREIAVRRAGDAIGEMSIIRQEPRMATMVAASPVTALTLERKAFESILKSRPEVSLGVMRVLCDRLLESERRNLSQAPVS